MGLFLMFVVFIGYFVFNFFILNKVLSKDLTTIIIIGQVILFPAIAVLLDPLLERTLYKHPIFFSEGINMLRVIVPFVPPVIIILMTNILIFVLKK
ncbi:MULTISPECIES: hypothetical protein [Bacillaceae]|uniref:Uncharacterized protein n=1 Tax=Evansella alkalicola TaxID=745819 RepID=A0ABS6JZL2_9BACI|nr:MULTISPECIES: hypothetical protein [Bacillaceae]MBU9723526.1 hypothetical protein [Bacillus alkalicola]